ncbi:GDP-mannose 4,6-dehydratase [Candidatus Pelagibacter sp.]|nr:GDP-mannose 4,6-dehydratase [Candidatus Pelagibacter sp.]
MKFKKILILGSNSFSGSSLINFLYKKKNLKVFSVSRSKEAKLFLPHKYSNDYKKVNFRQIDINKDFNKLKNYIKKIKPNYIIDFVSQGMVNQSWSNPEQWYETNVVAKARMHNFLKDCKFLKKYLRISTPEIYGNKKKNLKECFDYVPSSPYAVSHAAMDMNLKILYEKFNFPVIFLRPSNFYGPGQKLYRIIPKTIYSIIKKKKLILDGGGVAVRSFIFADDFSEAVYKCLTKGKVGEVYHIASDEYVSIKSLIIKICKKLSVNIKDVVDVGPERISQDSKYVLDTKKIKNKLKWTPKINLDIGLDLTIKWVKENINNFKKDDLNYKHKK